jgi:hypothetical protein
LKHEKSAVKNSVYEKTSLFSGALLPLTNFITNQMEQEVLEKIENQDKKLDEIFKSVEKMRKYFLWTLVVAVATVVLPLVALIVILPWFLNVITSAYNIQ